MTALNADTEFREKVDALSSIRMLEYDKDEKFCAARSAGVSKSITKLNADPEFRKNQYSYGKSGHFESIKAGKVHYRSSYELAAYKLLDADANVITFFVEPFGIPYSLNNNKHTYYPDLLIKYIDKELLVEIKPANRVNEAINIEKFSAAIKYCSASDMSFEVWTETELQIKQRKIL